MKNYLIILIFLLFPVTIYAEGKWDDSVWDADRWDADYSITASANAGGSILCTPSNVAYDLSSTCTLQSDDGYHTTDVKVDGKSAGVIAEYTFSNVTENHTIEATFASDMDSKQYKLNVKKAGKGSGNISSEDELINCGGGYVDCSGTYYENVSILLIATADENSIFTKWTGCEEVVGDTCAVTMNKANTVTANFARLFALTVSKKGGGTISCKAGGDDVEDCTDTSEVPYAEGTKMVLTQSPDENSIFKGWSGHCKGKNSSCAIVMNGNKTVTANYELAKADISVLPASLKFGTVKINGTKTKKLRITNKGNAVLTVTDIISDADFSTNWDHETIEIQPKKSSFVTISFKPKTIGIHTGTLKINSNDSDTSELEIQLTGTGK